MIKVVQETNLIVPPERDSWLNHQILPPLSKASWEPSGVLG